jgi:hypothetical protein
MVIHGDRTEDQSAGFTHHRAHRREDDVFATH